ncbi:hypothetical protein ACFPM7_20890 [Actinokineospora guangxiensis]|uniref:Uncharacterized protein n=1 Tax=Actinokineospora guangxiensis TaxID=1490288 RepID=A0ABW0EQ27_9PSEU
MVVEPRIGSSSAGVSVLAGPEDVADVDNAVVQAFSEGDVHHVDGPEPSPRTCCGR